MMKLLDENDELAKFVMGNVAIARGKRSVASGRGIKKSNVVTGDQNVVFGQDARGNVVFTGDIRQLILSSGIQTDPKALLESYLSRLVNEVGWLNPTVIDRALASDATRARLSLAQIYTNLDTLSSEISERAMQKRPEAELGTREPRRVSVLQILNRESKLVLLAACRRKGLWADKLGR